MVAPIKIVDSSWHQTTDVSQIPLTASEIRVQINSLVAISDNGLGTGEVSSQSTLEYVNKRISNYDICPLEDKTILTSSVFKAGTSNTSFSFQDVIFLNKNTEKTHYINYTTGLYVIMCAKDDGSKFTCLNDAVTLTGGGENPSIFYWR